MNWNNFYEKGYVVTKVENNDIKLLEDIVKDLDNYLTSILRRSKIDFSDDIEEKVKKSFSLRNRKDIYQLSQKLNSLYFFLASHTSNNILSDFGFKIPLFRNLTLRIDIPGEIFLQPPHQDINQMVSVKSFTAWLPLIFKNETCQIMIYEDSHKYGILEHKELSKENPNFKTFDNNSISKFNKKKIEVKYGEVLIFHPYLIHESAKSDSFRLTYLYRFDDLQDSNWLGISDNPHPSW